MGLFLIRGLSQAARRDATFKPQQAKVKQWSKQSMHQLVASWFPLMCMPNGPCEQLLQQQGPARYLQLHTFSFHRWCLKDAGWVSTTSSFVGRFQAADSLWDEERERTPPVCFAVLWRKTCSGNLGSVEMPSAEVSLSKTMNPPRVRDTRGHICTVE